MAARSVIAERGPERVRMLAIAVAADVSRTTLYKWFPTKTDLFEALTAYEKQAFEARLREVIEAQPKPAQKLDSALGLMVTYLDGLFGPDPIGVDPAFALDSLARSLGPQRATFVRLLGDALDVVPAVRQRQLSREQAAELFIRVAYSHYLVRHPEPEALLADLRSLAGLSRRSVVRAAG